MATSIAEFLGAGELVEFPDLNTFNGFNGLHGGLVTALLLRNMRAHVPADRELVSATARFIRPLGGRVSVDSELVKPGSTATMVRATAATDGTLGVDATAVFGTGQSGDFREFSPEMPVSITSRGESKVFSIPAEFVPFSQRVEIRPATAELPYTGSKQPVLCAWMRLNEDVEAVDERLIILVDALAPSYAAVLQELRMVPTVEISIHLAAAAYRKSFDWVLVHAESTIADTRGWIREAIEVWSEDGTHLASCSQLRIVR